MSNLSELLPAGAGAKSAKFVASGTLASGVTVGLKSNGQVGAVSIVASSPVVFETGYVQFTQAAFDSNSNKVVVAYMDSGNSNYGTVVIGTVSGSTISFATPVVFVSASASFSTPVFDPSTNKIVLLYSTPAAKGQALVGTVSGASISFGTAVTFEGSDDAEYIAAVYDAKDQKVVIAYRGVSNYGYAIVGTVSGTSISFGSKATLYSGIIEFIGIAYDSTAEKVVIGYKGISGLTGYGRAVVGTVSGTSISFGTEVIFAGNGDASFISPVYDSNANKIVISYIDAGNSNYGTAIVGTVSGTSISFGTAVVFAAATTEVSNSIFDSANNKVVIAFNDGGNSLYGTAIVGTVSGTSISFNSELVFEPAETTQIGITFDSSANKTIIAYNDAGNSNYGTAVTFDATAIGSSDFVGITDEAIANTATGSVVVQGGVITNTGLVPLGAVLGTKTAFSSVQSQYVKSTFDSSNNKTVTVYIDNNNYGTAVVGTVSGSSVSFGTPVIFNSNNTIDTCATFDTNYNKVFISYANSSTYPQGRVGTVSGTSISFGSEDAYINSQCINIAPTFDSNLNKVVVAYADSGNSGYAKSQVITLDGGASPGFSYGTPVVFNSKNTEYISSTFDSSNNKVVLSYAASTNANGVRVGTVSGSAISFGTELAFHAASQASYISSTFDTTNNKVVIFFAVGGANSTEAVVGTVSGTSITLGTQVRVGNSTSSNSTGVCFDSTQNKIMLAYRGTVGGTQLGRLAIGTVSGTSMTVADAVTFNSAATAWNSPIFDSNAKKTVLFFQDGASPYAGYGIVVNVTTDLTIGTDYFVQNDGTISTTSSSVPAGRALSTTSMLLEG